MSNQDKSWPAFPSSNTPETGFYAPGMTLRDYFASQAMQGFASDPAATWKNGLDGMADAAYRWADAMLKARAA
jgi:hypothetical protein